MTEENKNEEVVEQVETVEDIDETTKLKDTILLITSKKEAQKKEKDYITH